MLLISCAVLFASLGIDAAKIEGLPCRHDVYNGTCVLAKHCQTLILDHWIDHRPTLCGFRGKEPIICCTSCKLVDDIDDIYFNSLHGVLTKNKQKSYDACVDYVRIENVGLYGCANIHKYEKVYDTYLKCHNVKITKTILDHRAATRTALPYPFLALLGYGPSVEEAHWHCAGSVLTERFILTAAHCIADPRLGDVKYATLGVSERSQIDQVRLYHTFSEIIPHPEYASPLKYHHIALLKTEEEFVFYHNLVPACLYSGRPIEKTDLSRATVLGWGSKGPNLGLSNSLLMADIDKFTDKECAEQYPPYRHMPDGFDNNTQLCYGDRKVARDTCEGDSGGPLILTEGEVSCASTLIGVTSTGETCGSPGAGLYTRVEYYKPWIESIVWP